MLRPTNPSSAGSSVTDAVMVTSTPSAVPIATPRNVSVLRTSSPSRAMTTVLPAKSTARPAVSSATTVAASGSRPESSASRYRVTMNSA